MSFGGLTEGSVGTRFGVIREIVTTREFASQISGKKVKSSNPKAVVAVTIDNQLLHPRVDIEYSMHRAWVWRKDSGKKTTIDTVNMSFKKILHTVQDQIREVDIEMDKANYDAFRKQQQKYILDGIKYWEDKHKQMIKEMGQSM